MPVFVEALGGRPLWTKKQHSLAHGAGVQAIRIALVNNMPDAALEDTELQFFDLLDAACGDVPVVVKLYSLAGVPRTDRGMRRLNSFYHGLDDLWTSRFDALIMTGTEPLRPTLREEPYWGNLANVLDWAERNTVSTILSCLAAHAGVLHSDGIERHRLNDKRFGVFEFPIASGHALTQSMGSTVRFPHSRWNEVQADALESSGYSILSQSPEAGVDFFVKRKKQSLFVHFQGHPEYQTNTLLKEYRRDIKRYLRHERETYPTAPLGYFGDEAMKCVAEFGERSVANRCEEVMEEFPETFLTRSLQNGWRVSAVKLYSNWLSMISERKAEAFSYAPARVRQSGNTLQWID
jgi:homoserine O-succinyltransferase/O-acetyltransferase